MFHDICGDRITLLNNNKTAKRNLAEFNNGLVFSKDPLLPNYLFEVRIEKKIYAWSGSLEIGVTQCSPDGLDVIPSNAADLTNGTWILSGRSVLKDGRSVLDIYGFNLNNIEEGDVVGVMKSDQNELIFSLNGEYKGIAAYHIPYRVFAVVDLYGQVAQASVLSYSLVENIQASVMSTDLDTFDGSDITEGNSLLSSLVTNFDLHTIGFCGRIEDNLSPAAQNVPSVTHDRIRFHPRCGTLIKIYGNGRTAERMKPMEEFNNGVVITHRPLHTEELFEVRIDVLVDKWSGSIEVGITTHNADTIQFPPTMTNLKSGTIMMSGGGILTNGKATKRDYGDFNLDELMVGDRIGLIRKSDGDLHLMINGLDQGVAASNVPELFWGVVDLYGRTVKVTIVDRDEREEKNLITRRINIIGSSDRNSDSLPSFSGSEEESDCLMFHRRCGAHVTITNNNRTAYRPHALDDFNNAVVLTHRPLKPNEPFEVKLDKIVYKWAGSMEIGVTSHSPDELEFPSTMTNVRSGTWMMTGNGAMHNGTTVVEDYGTALERLQVGDRLAIVIKDNGSLHLFINGVDQGEVVANITSPMYGVIDLYGQAAQATIIEYDMLCCCTTPSDNGLPFTLSNQQDQRFNDVHGRNIRLFNRGKTAVRLHSWTEFTNAVVVCNRALRDNEMFAVIIEKVVDRWSGSIEAGVTAVKLDDPNELPATMTDLDHDTWMLSGSTVMKDSVTIKHGYALNLDAVQVGMVLGIMRHSDGSLHYYLDGVDQGEACSQIPELVYPAIDLYGQCVQVSIVNDPEPTPEISSDENWVEEIVQPVQLNQTLFYNPDRCFSQCCGKNITLSENDTVATRTASYNYGIVFSNFVLEYDKLYEMTITKWTRDFAGSLCIGVTTFKPEKITSPPTVSRLKPDTWYIIGDEVWHNGRLLKAHYCHNLHWLQCGSTVGIRISSDRVLHFYINGQDQGVAATDMPPVLYAVLDLYGTVSQVTMNRDTKDLMVSSLVPSVDVVDSVLSPSGASAQETLTTVKDVLRLDDLKAERAKMEYCLLKNIEKEKNASAVNDNITSVKEWSFFRELTGRNIKLQNNARTAIRTESYNQGVVIVSKSLERDTLFQVTIDQLNPRWVSSIMIGIICSPLTRSSLPVTAFGFKKDAWLISGDSVFHNGQKIKSRYGPNLETLRVSQKVGIMVDSNNQLSLFVDEEDQGVAAVNIPPVCYVVMDLYGQCEQVSIAMGDTVEDNRTNTEVVHQSITHPDEMANETLNSDLTTVLCEKADLERHEKESPSDDDSIDASWLLLKNHLPHSDSEDEGSVSRLKLHKTNENNAMVASNSYSTPATASLTESHVKIDRKNENAFVASCSNFSSDNEFPSKTNKTNENNSVLADSMSELRNHSLTISCSENSEEREQNANKKLVIENENSSLQNVEATRNTQVTNCDHKTNLHIANSMYIQAEKSNSKSKTESAKNISPTAINDRPNSLTRQNPNCEYRLRCCRFRNFLGLPAGFFSSDSSIFCYCSKCCSVLAQESKGDPPSTYSVPSGWCKFPLRKHLMTNNVDALTLEKWHVAFVGVSVGDVRRILDSGQLMAPDKLRFGYSAGKQSKLKDENYKFQIILSPLIKYATTGKFVPKYYRYVDQKTKVPYTCTAAFQVLVRPGSYKVGPPSSKMTSKSADSVLNVSNIEWVVKEEESTVLSAVLLKMDPL